MNFPDMLPIILEPSRCPRSSAPRHKRQHVVYYVYVKCIPASPDQSHAESVRIPRSPLAHSSSHPHAVT